MREDFLEFSKKNGMTIGTGKGGNKSMRRKLIDSGLSDIKNLNGRNKLNYERNKEGNIKEKRWWSDKLNGSGKRIIKPMCDNKLFCFGHTEVSHIDNYSYEVEDSISGVRKGIEMYISYFEKLDDTDKMFVDEIRERGVRDEIRKEKSRQRELEKNK